MSTVVVSTNNKSKLILLSAPRSVAATGEGVGLRYGSYGDRTTGIAMFVGDYDGCL